MHQSQVIWAVLWSYKMTMLSSMLCQTTPATLYLIARAIFDSIPRSGDIIFSTEGSIKQMERQMLGTSDTLIISGPLQKNQLIGRHF